MSYMLKYSPTVFAVGNEYKIFVPVKESSVMWIKVGEKSYYDHSNGVLRSAVSLHKITVPKAELDKEKKYTVCYRKMIKRLPYFSEVSDVFSEEFSFSPVPFDNIRLYHIAEAHGLVDAASETAENFKKLAGGIDLLVLNGDVIDHSGDITNFDAIYEIASNVTGGSIPVVFSRGNHDTRGFFAENIADYSPTRDGHSYFSFRVGPIWGLVLDCGEDKDDSHAEYGYTNCCHAFREEETEYLKKIIKNSNEEYLADGVKYRIIASHVPFTRRFSPPFNIEEDIYSEWARLLSENVKPNVMIAGHTHTLELDLVGSKNDALGQPCPVFVASKPNRNEKTHVGGGLIFEKDKIRAIFIDKERILSEHTIMIK